MTAPAAERPVLRPLARSECLALLRRSRRGRAVFSAAGLVQVVPLAFSIEHGVLRFTGGTAAAAAGQVVTFQCDGYDEVAEEWWSVLATGRAAADSAGVLTLEPSLIRGAAERAGAPDAASG